MAIIPVEGTDHREINYKNIFKFIHDRGYDGILGMEHGNFHKGAEGEEALIKAYRAVDVD